MIDVPPAPQPAPSPFGERARRRVPLAMAIVAALIVVGGLLSREVDTWSWRDVAAAVVWVAVLGAAIGSAASLPAPRGRWWRWAAPALGTLLSLPVLAAAGFALAAGAGMEVGWFGDPTVEPDAAWYPAAIVALLVGALASAVVGLVGAGRRRVWALAPVGFAGSALAIGLVLAELA